MPIRRILIAITAALLAACADDPRPADPLVVAANIREQAKLAALAGCHSMAGAETAAWGDGTFMSLVDRCMESRGYLRQDEPAVPVAGG